MSSPNNSSSSKYDTSSGYLAMEYDDFDVVVSDLNERKLEEIGKDKEIEHLSAGIFPTPSFPVEGFIHGPNMRLMVPLVLQRYKKPDSKIINAWFLVDSASPFTCLTVKTLEAFYGSGNVVGQAVERKKCTECGKTLNEEDSMVNDKIYTMAIQDQSIGIECKVSKGRFEQVNILGTDALQNLKLSILMDWDAGLKTFILTKM